MRLSECGIFTIRYSIWAQKSLHLTLSLKQELYLALKDANHKESGISDGSPVR